MADIFGMSLCKSEILERVGDISQICDARKMAFTDGRASGVESIEISTGSGFSLTVVPSRSLDISRASYNGMPVSWRSAVGETSPYLYQPDGIEWLRGFFGGLLTTCGISHSSHPCEDEGEQLGLHGRVANIPAENVTIDKKWVGDNYLISVSGQIREVGVYCDNLILNRTIETSLGSKSIMLTDIVHNAGFRESPLMMLYHINPGWPVLSENSHIVAPAASSYGFDDLSQSEIDTWSVFDSPQVDYKERVYVHDMSPDTDGIVKLALVNESKNIGVFMKYPKKEFPYFVQWKMIGQGEYVVGIEPGNITGSRAKMRADGTLEFIKPDQKRTFSIELGVLSDETEIKEFIADIEE